VLHRDEDSDIVCHWYNCPSPLKYICLHFVLLSDYGKCNKNENGDLLANSHNILYRLKDYIFQLLNVHTVSDFRQIVIHTAEPFVSRPSLFKDEIAIAKLKKYKSPGSDQIWQDWFKQEVI
jgi:hypothetical protein